MESCEQTQGQTIKQHGEAVWDKTKKLITGDFEGFRLPEWFIQNHHFLVNNLTDWETIKQYNLFHDCGKPFCLEVDEEGKRHFPNHASVSKEKWLESDGDARIGHLIGLDMLFHTCGYDEIASLNLSSEDLSTLIITAFAEIHANAEMFGGIESTSFKIKYKKLCRRAKPFVLSLNRHVDAHSYLIIRNDLPAAQKVVQSAHASLELRADHHPSLVAVKVKNEFRLKKVMSELIENSIQFKIFRDDLFNHEITAICTEPLTDKREVLSRYCLLDNE